MYCTGGRGVYLMSLVCILFNIIMFIAMICMRLCARDISRDVVFMVIFMVSYVFGWVIEEVIIRCMLAKMVPSHCQSFTESCRNAVSRSSTIVASVSAPLVLDVLEWWGGGLLVLITACLVLFVWRRKHLIDINEIQFPTDTNPNTNA